MKGHGAKYPRKKDAAIAALLQYPTLEKAAEAVGIGQTTLWRWTREEDFQEAYKAAKKASLGFALERLQESMVLGVEVLRDVAADVEFEKSPVRVVAAKALLALGLKAVETQDLRDRIERLEERINNRNAA